MYYPPWLRILRAALVFSCVICCASNRPRPARLSTRSVHEHGPPRDRGGTPQHRRQGYAQGTQ
eukprot:4796039-Heterocapsa_arctica.AAC.1